MGGGEKRMTEERKRSLIMLPAFANVDVVDGVKAGLCDGLGDILNSADSCGFRPSS